VVEDGKAPGRRKEALCPFKRLLERVPTPSVFA